MKIIRGKTKPKGLRIVVYGVPGVGKTSLISKLPKTLFMDFEEGTHGLDVAKISPDELPDSYDGMKGIIADLKRDHQGFEHLCIDTADKCELCVSDALARKKGIEDVFAVDDYGRTIAVHKRGMASILDAATSLCNTGFDVIVLAHETSRKVEPLERNEGKTYDHTELRLSKSVSNLFYDWADVVIFLGFKTFYVEGQQKGKGHVDGGKRWAYCTYSNDWEAKHRVCVDLPDDLPLDKLVKILPSVIDNAVDRVNGVDCEQMIEDAEQVETEKNETPQPEPKQTPEPQIKPERKVIADLRKRIANYALTNSQIMSYLAGNAKVAERYGKLDGIAFEDLPDSLVAWLSRGMDKIAEKIK